MKKYKAVLFYLLIIAITSATISPACAFISGKGGDWVEICSGLQTKRIQTDTQSTPPDMTEKQCPFCFHHLNMSGIESYPFFITINVTAFFHGFHSESALVKYLTHTGNKDPPIKTS